MSTAHSDAVIEELALLRAEIQELRAGAGRRDRADLARRVRIARPLRQRAAVCTAIVLAAATVMGVAAASTPGHPADVTFIPLSVPHKILSNASIAKGATNSPVVNGGSTTVPTDATSVQMTVTVKSTAAGSLSIFPTDNPGSATADTVSFPAGNVLASAVTKQTPGLSSKVSFKNNGTATAVVTVTITGYSTQTTASNVSGSGGTAGQVLTNNGSGALWQNLPPEDAAHFSGSGGTTGQVLTNNGAGGASWQPAGGAAYATTQPGFTNTLLGPTYTTVASRTVPAGTYQVTATGTATNYSTTTYVHCALFSPAGTQMTDQFVTLAPGSGFGGLIPVALTALTTTTGGNITAQCLDYYNSGHTFMYDMSLVATQVSSGTGNVAPAARANTAQSQAGTAKQPTR
jgi:hypothetical protein